MVARSFVLKSEFFEISGETKSFHGNLYLTKTLLLSGNDDVCYWGIIFFRGLLSFIDQCSQG